MALFIAMVVVGGLIGLIGQGANAQTPRQRQISRVRQTSRSTPSITQLRLQERFLAEGLIRISSMRSQSALSHAITDMNVNHALTQMEGQLGQGLAGLRRELSRLEFIEQNCFNLDPRQPTRFALFMQCPHPRSPADPAHISANDYQTTARSDYAIHLFVATQMAASADAMAASYFRLLTSAAEGTGYVLAGAAGSGGVMGGVVCLPALVAGSGILATLGTMAQQFLAAGGSESLFAHLIAASAAVYHSTGEQGSAGNAPATVEQGGLAANESAQPPSPTPPTSATPNLSSEAGAGATTLAPVGNVGTAATPTAQAGSSEANLNEDVSIDEVRYQRELARYRAALRRLRALQLQAQTQAATERQQQAQQEQPQMTAIRSLDALSALAQTNLMPWHQGQEPPRPLKPWNAFLEEWQEALRNPEAHEVPTLAFGAQSRLISRIIQNVRQDIHDLDFDQGHVEESMLRFAQSLQDRASQILIEDSAQAGNQTNLTINGINCYPENLRATMDSQCFSHLLVHAMNELSITMPLDVQVTLLSPEPHETTVPILHLGSAERQVQLNLMNGERQVPHNTPLPALYSTALLDALLLQSLPGAAVSDHANLIAVEAWIPQPQPQPPPPPAPVATNGPRSAVTPVTPSAAQNQNDLGPAQVRQIDAINEEIRRGLIEWHRTDRMPYDWVSLAVEAEVSLQNPRITQREYDAVQRAWQNTLREARTALEALPADATAIQRIETVRDILVTRTVGAYTRDTASLLDALRKRGTNCQGNSQLLLGALSVLGISPPPGERFAMELFIDHVQVITWNPRTNAVWDILGSSATIENPRGWVYSTPIVGQSYLELARDRGSRVVNPLTAEQLLLANPHSSASGLAGPRGNLASLLRMAIDSGFRRPRNSLGWPLTLGMLFRGGLAKPADIPRQATITSPGHRTDAPRPTTAQRGNGSGNGTGAETAGSTTTPVDRPIGNINPPSNGAANATSNESQRSRPSLPSDEEFRAAVNATLNRIIQHYSPVSSLAINISHMTSSCQTSLRQECTNYAVAHLQAVRRLEAGVNLFPNREFIYHDANFLNATRTFFTTFQGLLQQCLPARIRNDGPVTTTVVDALLAQSNLLAARPDIGSEHLSQDMLLQYCTGNFIRVNDRTLNEGPVALDINYIPMASNWGSRSNYSGLLLGLNPIQFNSSTNTIRYSPPFPANRSCDPLSTEDPIQRAQASAPGTHVISEGITFFLPSRAAEISALYSANSCAVEQLHTATFRQGLRFIENASRGWLERNFDQYYSHYQFNTPGLEDLYPQLMRELHNYFLTDLGQRMPESLVHFQTMIDHFFETLASRAYAGRSPLDPPLNAAQVSAQRILTTELFGVNGQERGFCYAIQQAFSNLAGVAAVHHQLSACYGAVTGTVATCAADNPPQITVALSEPCRNSAVLTRLREEFRAQQAQTVAEPARLVAQLSQEPRGSSEVNRRIGTLFSPETILNPTDVRVSTPSLSIMDDSPENQPAAWALPLLNLFEQNQVGVLEPPVRPRGRRESSAAPLTPTPQVTPPVPNITLPHSQSGLVEFEFADAPGPQTDHNFVTTPRPAEPVNTPSTQGTRRTQNPTQINSRQRLLIPPQAYFNTLINIAISSGNLSLIWNAMTPSNIRSLLRLLQRSRPPYFNHLFSSALFLGLQEIAIRNRGSVNMPGLRGISPELRSLVRQLHFGSDSPVYIPVSSLRPVRDQQTNETVYVFNNAVERALLAMRCRIARNSGQNYRDGHGGVDSPTLNYFVADCAENLLFRSLPALSSTPATSGDNATEESTPPAEEPSHINNSQEDPSAPHD